MFDDNLIDAHIHLWTLKSKAYPLEIGFNGNYLLEILRYLPTDDVRLTLKGSERAVTISAEGWDNSADYLCLLMPLRLVD